MIDINKKYRTRSGLEAGVYAVVEDGGKYPVHGWVRFKNGCYTVITWTRDGKITPNGESQNDLIEVREPVTITVAVNKNGTAWLTHPRSESSNSVTIHRVTLDESNVVAKP